VHKEKHELVVNMVAYSATLNGVDVSPCAASVVERFELQVDLDGSFQDRFLPWKLFKDHDINEPS
jgi:hypothetical protein